jgi:cytochrome P450
METKPDGESQAFKGALVCAPWFYKQWMVAGNPANFFDRLVCDYGDFVQYHGLLRFYLVNHPSLVKQVLIDTNRSFNKNSSIYNRFRNAFGNGLVVAEGERWKRQRKLMQPMFSLSAIKHFFDHMVGAATEMTDRWAVPCKNNEVFDIADEMSHVTLEIAGRSFFHNGFDRVRDQIMHWVRVINHYSAKPPLPIVSNIWFPSPTNLRLKIVLKKFHAFLREMIESRRTGEQQKDLLSILLHTKHEESGDAMTDLEVMEEVLGMIIGGHETSSAALTWTLYELHRHPEIQKRLHEEIDAVVGDRPLTADDIPHLTFARMILDESMRLHPPFWFENRNTTADVEMGGAIIPKGSMVAFSRYSLHRHADFWKQPAEFDPERFNPAHEENKRSSYAYVPFGGGPRICIGVNFAMMELLVILAVIAQRYTVVVDVQDRHEMTAHLTMTPKYGVKVRLESR